VLGNLRADLTGISVNGLLAAEDAVKGTVVLILQHINKGGDNLGGCQSIGTAKGTVGNQVSFISTGS
jgi:hypothetical protein